MAIETGKFLCNECQGWVTTKECDHWRIIDDQPVVRLHKAPTGEEIKPETTPLLTRLGGWQPDGRPLLDADRTVFEEHPLGNWRIDSPQDRLQRILLDAYPGRQTRRPGGTTIDEAAKLWRIDYTTARLRLKRLVEKGVLYREWCELEERAGTWVYYLVNETAPGA